MRFKAQRSVNLVLDKVAPPLFVPWDFVQIPRKAVEKLVEDTEVTVFR